jgi:GH25 family lysozyme M1 (1,4-beta-N-acetylmuramidase)
MVKKNDLFVDVASHQGYDISGILEEAGTTNTIIKVSESTSYLNPCLSAQVSQSNPIGFYHFAWFGGNEEEAEAEARYFLANVPKQVKYLVLDYEDHASASVQRNTTACLRFMQVIAEAGYKPIYYSYKPFTIENVDYQQILEQFPNSLWIAGYGLNDGTANFEYFPSMDGIRWWQYSSNPFDKNIVLLDDEEDEKPKTAGTWKQDSNGWWFRRNNGSFPYNKWEKIGGVWYYFDSKGYCLTSEWLKDNEKWYYLKDNGAMATGWVLVGSEWYYMDDSGAMVTGWVKYKNNWYYMTNERGNMVSNEFIKSGKGWYFMSTSGELADNPSFTKEPDGLITVA